MMADYTCMKAAIVQQSLARLPGLIADPSAYQPAAAVALHYQAPENEA